MWPRYIFWSLYRPTGIYCYCCYQPCCCALWGNRKVDIRINSLHFSSVFTSQLIRFKSFCLQIWAFTVFYFLAFHKPLQARLWIRFFSLGFWHLCVIKNGESISLLKEPRMALKSFLFLSLTVKEGSTVISSGSPHRLCLPVKNKWYVASEGLM